MEMEMVDYLLKLKIDLCLFFRAKVVNKPISLFSQVWNTIEEKEQNHSCEIGRSAKDEKIHREIG